VQNSGQPEFPSGRADNLNRCGSDLATGRLAARLFGRCTNIRCAKSWLDGPTHGLGAAGKV